MSIRLCINARRAEVFATTAAYVAVLVGPLKLTRWMPNVPIVFVSGDFGGSKIEYMIQLDGGLWKTVSCPN
jgi:hypothetical protein